VIVGLASACASRIEETPSAPPPYEALFAEMNRAERSVEDARRRYEDVLLRAAVLLDAGGDSRYAEVGAHAEARLIALESTGAPRESDAGRPGRLHRLTIRACQRYRRHEWVEAESHARKVVLEDGNQSVARLVMLAARRPQATELRLLRRLGMASFEDRVLPTPPTGPDFWAAFGDRP